jgi:hypothetical protein
VRAFQVEYSSPTRPAPALPPPPLLLLLPLVLLQQVSSLLACQPQLQLGKELLVILQLVI